MYFDSENILLVGSLLIFTSILFSKTGYRFGIPTLLLFLIVGMGFGCDGLGLQFSNVEDAQFIGMLALSVILFSGGMDTRLRDVRPVMAQGIVLSTVGVLLTTAFTGLFIFYLSRWTNAPIQLPLLTCMLMAATMSSTDSASVFNLLRTQRMNLRHNLRPTLELESGSNDPMAYMLTVVLIQVISTGGGLTPWAVVRDFLVQFAVGGLAGYAFGRFATWLLARINLSTSSLYPILLISLVFITFTISDQLRGNGYLAVYVAGIVVGNARLPFRKEIDTFMQGMTWLFQIVMFLTLGLLVNPHELLSVAVVSIVVGVFMIVAARPASVFLSLLPFRNITPRSKLFISWVGLRGAVPIIFATYPVVAAIPGAEQIFNIVFFITLLSLTLQGMTIAPVARRLGLDLPAEHEVNTFGVEIPEELDSRLNDITLTADMLARGNRLCDMHLPQGTLVMMVKRGGDYIVPNGQVELRPGDVLLLISEGRAAADASDGLPT